MHGPVRGTSVIRETGHSRLHGAGGWASLASRVALSGGRLASVAKAGLKSNSRARGDLVAFGAARFDDKAPVQARWAQNRQVRLRPQ